MNTIIVGIALGANLGDRRANMTSGFAFLDSIAGTGRCRASSVLESEPVDCPPGSGLFLNAVAEIDYPADGDPYKLLDLLLCFEGELGRAAKENRDVNAPRPIDLDLLYFGDCVIDDPPRLIVPHPRMAQRAFVMQPLAEIQPDLLLPGETRTVREIAAGL